MDIDMDDVETVVYKYVILLVGLIGIVGNAIILSVLLTSAQLRESSYVYLTSMTVFDIGVNALAIGIGIVRGYKECISSKSSSVFEVFVFLPAINMMATASLWTVLAMAIERFVFVAYPLRRADCCQRRTARIVIGLICVASVVLNLPRYFLYREIIDRGQKRKETERTEDVVYDYFLPVSVCEGLSFAALVYFNIRLMVLLHGNSRFRRTMVASFSNPKFAASRTRDETRLSLTLSAIVALAVVTNACTLLASEPLGRLLYGHDYKNTDGYRLSVLIGDLAVLVGSSFNVVFYAIFNSRFKREFCKTFAFCVRGRNRHEQESTKGIIKRFTIYHINPM